LLKAAMSGDEEWGVAPPPDWGVSGGQQQRVFLSFSTEAELFCFDEPFIG